MMNRSLIDQFPITNVGAVVVTGVGSEGVEVPRDRSPMTVLVVRGGIGYEDTRAARKVTKRTRSLRSTRKTRNIVNGTARKATKSTKETTQVVKKKELLNLIEKVQKLTETEL